MNESPIQLCGVTKRYPHFRLRGIDLEVREGTVLGLIGPNGAGKSTLLRILMGLVRADSGRVTLLGREMPDAEAWIKARVGFVSEDMALYGAATLQWHMQLVRDLYPGWDERRAASLLERFQLDPGQRVRGLMDDPGINSTVPKRLEEIAAKIDHDEFDVARELIKKLKEDLNGTIPDIVEAEATIAMLEPEDGAGA